MAGTEGDPPDSSTGEGTVDLDEDVLEMVRRQLERDPPPSTRALYGRAVHLNSDLYDLSVRQFHAKYPLRVKREKAREEREASSRSSTAGASGRGGDDGDPDGRRTPDAEVDGDAGRRHLFGDDDGRDRGGEDPRRSGRDGGADGPRRTASGDDAGPGGGGSGPDSAVPVDEATRERVRRVFMSFAREVAEAERPELLVGVVEGVPDCVDEIARIVHARPSEA